MSDGLQISDDLTLPMEAVTETFAILAKRGAGKTYTATVMAEEMLRTGLPVVVIDPVGVWWGLRSSADGTGDGLPVVIFGGDHGDLALTETSGALLADAIIDDRVPAVLDLSSFSKAASRRFVADFAERLYHRNRDALHLIIDEADAFAPQRVDPGQQRLLGAIEDLVRRGRARGLGVTLITQRPAVLNKDVLTQAEVLVALRMTGPRDVAAIDEWVRLHADDDQAKEVKKSLPSLPIGTAWVWSPGWLDLLQRVPIRKRTTFDSSATPKAGERRIVPQRMAEVDLAALGERIAALETETAADDPKALRRRIRELEKRLVEQPSAEPERVEVPVVTDAQLAELVDWTSRAQDVVDTLTGMVENVTAQLATVRAPEQRAGAASTAAPSRARTTQKPERPPTAPPEVGGLKAGARKMLATLGRQHPIRVSRAQLGTLSGFKHTGGTFGSYLSALRRADLIDETDGLLHLTEAGMAATDASSEPVGRNELLDQYRSVLKAGARAMLDHVVAAHPRPVGREELADATGFAASGGTFGSYLSTLRRNGLVETDSDGVALTDVLASA